MPRPRKARAKNITGSALAIAISGASRSIYYHSDTWPKALQADIATKLCHHEKYGSKEDDDVLQRPAPSTEALAESLEVINNWRKQSKYNKIKNFIKNLKNNQVNRKDAYEEAFKAHTQGLFQ